MVSAYQFARYGCKAQDCFYSVWLEDAMSALGIIIAAFLTILCLVIIDVEVNGKKY